MKFIARGICLVFSCTALFVSGSPVLTTLHSLSVFPQGAQPAGPLIQGLDGNLYGSTRNGGTNGGFGTIFRMTTNGVVTTLYTFSDGSDGAAPSGNLVQATDGNLYGTTQRGGDTFGDGTIFRISTNGSFTSLYEFTGGADGSIPVSGLIQGADGSLYGAARNGGDDEGDGTIFQITTDGVFTVLYTFTGGSDGSEPVSALIQGVDGNLYGTAEAGGDENGDGTVFQLTTNGVFATFYQFTGGADGGNPSGGLVQGIDGNLYGTTQVGGDQNGAGDGTVFQISTNGVFNTLYLFTGGVDGFKPTSGLVQGTNGILYGSTFSGAAGGRGALFQVTTNGVFTTLYTFPGGSDGANPLATLLCASDGQLYGSTLNGNTNGAGTLFKISSVGEYSQFFSFPGNNDGAFPWANLILGQDGNYYGTTELGGELNQGVVFRATPEGAITVLHSFGSITPFVGLQTMDGFSPEGPLIQGGDGTFYGTTFGGGTNGSGVVFSITTNGLFKVLHSLVGPSDGANPSAGLIFGQDGNLYGTAFAGGASNEGTLFQITTNGSFTTLTSFIGNNGGPECTLLQGADGYLYGTTAGNGGYGAVFRASTNGGYVPIHSFTGGADGANPQAGLVLGADGAFYGTTSSWFISGYGAVFKVDMSGNFAVVAQFAGTNGASCMAPLALGKDGNLYGTTWVGGADDYGTLFQVTPAGVLTTLWSFDLAGGGYPRSLVLASNGIFYGLANFGEGGNGTFFRLDLRPTLQPLSQIDSTLDIGWTAVPGLKYQIQYRTNLSLGDWVNLGGTNVATNDIMQTTDTIGADAGRFYRAALLP